MKKDLIAVYLNEHPEFFNEYPELLAKIQSIEESDIPLEPLQTLSIADRIIKRAHDDKEHMKSRLQWFAEIIEANEALQERLFDIERAALTSMDLPAMLSRFCEEMTSRFNIPRALVCLVDDPALLDGDEVRQRLNGGAEAHIKLVDRAEVEGWFAESMQPVLHSEIAGGSELFGNGAGRPKIQSEIRIPIRICGNLAGALCMGSDEPYRFYDGLRTDFLVRTGEKLGIAIDNLLLLEKLKRQPLLDQATGFYNVPFLNIILGRKLDQARRDCQPLNSVKIRIDNLDKAPEGMREKVLSNVADAIKQTPAPNKTAVRIDDSEFFVLLENTDQKTAGQYAEKLQSVLQNNPDVWKTTITVAACPTATANPAQL